MGTARGAKRARAKKRELYVQARRAMRRLFAEDEARKVHMSEVSLTFWLG